MDNPTKNKGTGETGLELSDLYKLLSYRHRLMYEKECFFFFYIYVVRPNILQRRIHVIGNVFEVLDASKLFERLIEHV